MARIIADDLWLCDDCTIAAVNDDFSGMDEPRATEVANAIVATCLRLGGHLTSDSDGNTGEGIMEFTWRRCDCCGSNAGRRSRFCILK